MVAGPVDGQSSTVGPQGGSVFLPRGTTHTFQVVGPTPGKHWVMTTPSGCVCRSE
jgi:hypothetical protein